MRMSRGAHPFCLHWSIGAAIAGHRAAIEQLSSSLEVVSHRAVTVRRPTRSGARQTSLALCCSCEFVQRYRPDASMSRKRPLDETAAIGDAALACLEEDGWLTDDVVNAFFARISERFPSTYVFSSFFMSKLHGPAGYSYDAVRRWTRQTHIFGKALLLIPTYQRRARHWCLIVADMRVRPPRASAPSPAGPLLIIIIPVAHPLLL